MKTNHKHSAILLFSLLLGGIAHADTWYVSPNSPANGPATNWATAFHVIQDAVDAASAGDTVLVTNGIYHTGGRFEGLLTNRVAITQPITVESVNGPHHTIILGAPPLGPSAVRCAFVGPNATLRGFTLSDGYTNNDPGWTDPKLVSGGGAWINGGTIDNCLIVGNHAFLAGGGVVCAVASGREGSIINSVVSQNSSETNGGGIFFEFGGMASNCVVTGNSAGNNGGGGLFCWQTASVTHCTVADNFAPSNGSEVRFLSTVNIQVNNSIIWGDPTIAIAGTATSMSNNCMNMAQGINPITTSPMFIDFLDYHLSSNSPCIDAGIMISGLTQDAEGLPRSLDGNNDGSSVPDIGAYEFASNEVDTDGDGASDYSEAVADTDLSDSNVWFQITAYSNSAVFFPSSVNRKYALQYSTNLVDSTWLPVFGQWELEGNGGTNSFSTQETDSMGYYRVVVERINSNSSIPQ